VGGAAMTMTAKPRGQARRRCQGRTEHCVSIPVDGVAARLLGDVETLIGTRDGFVE
jgi:hypothetical protein